MPMKYPWKAIPIFLALGAPPAFAQTASVDVQQIIVPDDAMNGSIAVITQSGQSHQAIVEQTATGAAPGANKVVIDQNGADNLAKVSQTGQHDLATVMQYGSELKAEILQNGINLGVDVKQFGVGVGQTISVSQSGAGQAAPIVTVKP